MSHGMLLTIVLVIFLLGGYGYGFGHGGVGVISAILIGVIILPQMGRI